MASGSSQNLTDISGSSANNAIAVGLNGTILRYDGSSWTTMPSGILEDLNGVWGTSSSDVFAVGEKGTVIHYDGIRGTP